MDSKSLEIDDKNGNSISFTEKESGIKVGCHSDFLGSYDGLGSEFDFLITNEQARMLHEFLSEYISSLYNQR